MGRGYVETPDFDLALYGLVSDSWGPFGLGANALDGDAADGEQEDEPEGG